MIPNLVSYCSKLCTSYNGLFISTKDLYTVGIRSNYTAYTRNTRNTIQILALKVPR